MSKRKVTDLEKFSLEEIWMPFAATALKSSHSLEETAQLLTKGTDWSINVLDRIRRVGFMFPPYIAHPLVDVLRAAGAVP